MIPRRTSYDTQSPWMFYRYWMPDWLCWAVGFVVVGARCSICGKDQLLVKWIWGRERARGLRIRKALVDQHQHRSLQLNPMAWVYPAANYAAYTAWRKHQGGRHGLGLV